MNAGVAGSVLGSLDWVSRDLRPILTRALDGHEVSIEDGIALTGAEGRDFHALTLVADELRQRQAGDVVTYVVNRNVNFTNVCIKHCTFCAFSRDHREEEGYFLPVAEVVRRAQEARDLGATEVCIQAGLPPKLDGRYTSTSRARSRRRCRSCTSTRFRRRKCCTARCAPGCRSAST
jgi:2-iminoacetate synthase ThiH